MNNIQGSGTAMRLATFVLPTLSAEQEGEFQSLMERLLAEHTDALVDQLVAYRQIMERYKRLKQQNDAVVKALKGITSACNEHTGRSSVMRTHLVPLKHALEEQDAPYPSDDEIRAELENDIQDASAKLAAMRAELNETCNAKE